MSKQSFKHRFTRTTIATFVALIIALPASQALARQWNIEGKEVEAKLVDYNATHVLLEDDKGKQKTFMLKQLHTDDLKYVSTLMELKQAQSREDFQRKLLKQKQVELMMQVTDVWYVGMQAPNGQYFSRRIFADDSRQASISASRQFPNASVVGVRRQRRQNLFAGF